MSLPLINPVPVMPTESTPPETERLLEQACGWLSKMHSGEFSEVEGRQLANWRAADPAHERAWQKAEVLWQGLESLRGRTIPGSEPLVQECRVESSHSDFKAGPSPSGAEAAMRLQSASTNRIQAAASPVRRARFRRVKSTLAVACSALLAFTLAAFFPPLWWQADYLTGKGEQRAIVLADGSRVLLNTESALAVHFNDAIRRVELVQGEAFFEVAKDASHPFVVTASGSEVRAVGTAFNVRRAAHQVHVELAEGIVDVQDPQHLRRVRLSAGQTALIGADTIDVKLARRPENFALWRDGYLQFDGMPLQAAIEQINRYRPGRAVLLNKRLAGRRVSGLFRLDALDQAIAGLKAAVPELQTLSMTPYLVVLH
jgi:transmembrane sensor